MAQFIAFASADGVAPNRRSGNFQEPDRSRARKRGRSGTIIRPPLNRPNCRKLPLSSIRQTQESREARERSHFRRSRARRVKALLLITIIGRIERNDLDLGRERKRDPTAKVPDVYYSCARMYATRFTKLSYARRSRINYSYKTHQSFLHFLLPTRVRYAREDSAAKRFFRV